MDSLVEEITQEDKQIPQPLGLIGSIQDQTSAHEPEYKAINRQNSMFAKPLGEIREAVATQIEQKAFNRTNSMFTKHLGEIREAVGTEPEM